MLGTLRFSLAMLVMVSHLPSNMFELNYGVVSVVIFYIISGYSSKHPLIKLMQWTEDKAYRDADVVLSNLPYSVDHMVQRGMA